MTSASIEEISDDGEYKIKTKKGKIVRFQKVKVKKEDPTKGGNNKNRIHLIGFVLPPEGGKSNNLTLSSFSAVQTSNNFTSKTLGIN